MYLDTWIWVMILVVVVPLVVLGATAGLVLFFGALPGSIGRGAEGEGPARGARDESDPRVLLRTL